MNLTVEQALMRARWSRKDRKKHAAKVYRPTPRDQQQREAQLKGCTCENNGDLCEFCLLKDTL